MKTNKFKRALSALLILAMLLTAMPVGVLTVNGVDEGDTALTDDHVYDSECDTVCNDCKSKRTTSVEHEFKADQTECFKCAESAFKYKVTDGTASITDANSAISGNITVPATLDGYPVTSIGIKSTICYPFDGCTEVVSVTIPDGVTTLGNGAFEGCTGLTAVTIPPSVNFFDNNVFLYCDIVDVYISDMAAWVNATFWDSVWAWDDNHEKNLYLNGELVTDLVLPDEAKRVGAYAFHNYDKLTSVSIPDSVTEIGKYAFEGCNGLESVEIGNGVTVIGNSAFDGCSKLKSVSMGNSISTIGYYAFDECHLLEGVVLPDTVRSIGHGAFYECENLSSINIPYGITTIEESTFAWCRKLREIVIPDSVTTIGDLAFSDCFNLNTVVLSGKVTSIGNRAFEDCYSIDTIDLPDTVESIGNNAFTSLNCVYYRGTEEQKSSIAIGSENYNLNNTKWHYEVQDAVFADKDCYYCPECDNYFVSSGENCFATVVFKDWNGRVLSTQSVAYNGTVTSPAAPTRKHEQPNIYKYLFDGWDKEITACTGNEVYTATYREEYIEYTVVFKNSNGDIISSEIYHWGDEIVVPEAPCKEKDNTYTYTFSGWDKTVVPCNGNAVYTAVYTPTYIDYTVVFKDWDGTILSSGTYHYGDTPACSVVPERESDDMYYYVFYGWDKSVVACQGNAEYTAKYARYRNDGIKYSVEYGRVTITGYSGLGPVLVIPDTIEGLPVTKINREAFKGCINLTSVTIPSSVENIGYAAFRGCSNLESLTIPFVGATGHTDRSAGYRYPFGYIFGETKYTDSQATYQIPIRYDSDGYYSVSSQVCYYIPKSLKSVTVTGGIIGYGAFYNCSGLNKITVSDGVLGVNLYSFYKCTGLVSVELPQSIKQIDNYAFYGCESLSEISIPESVTSIGEYAFYGCKSLTHIAVPEKVTVINQYTFYGCESLRSVTIPESVYSIAARAFYGCKALTHITIPEGIDEIKEYTFYGCESLESVSLPKSLIIIGASAFYGCSSLADIDVHESVQHILEYAFAYCTSLTVFDVPGRVTVIQGSTFRGCSSLSDVVVPPEIEVKSYAFYGCKSLTDVWVKGNYCTFNIYSNNTPFSEADRHFGICPYDHTFSTVCTPKCSKCEWIRRDVVHSWNEDYTETATDHYILCPVCGTVKDRDFHIFDNACDTDCNICGYTRITPDHDFQWVVDEEETCGTEGVKHEECTVCHVARSENTVIPPTGEHIYNNACDIECNLCKQIREVPDHSYTLNGGYTCNICRYSRTPEAPVAVKRWDLSVVLQYTEGFEYSMDGEYWQRSNVFSYLSPNSTYTFYQRVGSNYNSYRSEISEPTVVVFKSVNYSSPVAPIVVSFTDTVVTLVPMEGCEYSCDGENWQKSHIFEGLLPGSGYLFYQRYAETDTFEASNKSDYTYVETDKSKQTQIPLAPTLDYFTESSITLVAVEGCEYSMDGKNWKSSPYFYGLDCYTEYTFYQRYCESYTHYAGKSSEGSTFRTDKGTLSAPYQPSLSNVSHTTVTLSYDSRYEYSRDGINWQKSNVFRGLSPETNYFFYCRYAETDTHYASEKSRSLTVKTMEAGEIESIYVQYTPNKLWYLEGESFDAAGMTVIAYFDNGAFEEIVDYTVNGYDSTPGEKEVKISYMGKEDSFTVYVEEKTLELIAVTRMPKRLVYLAGENFDSEGLEITAYYNNGTEEKITDYTLSGYDSEEGKKTVTVLYNGMTCDFEVTVLSEVPLEITSEKYTAEDGIVSGVLLGTTVTELLSYLPEGAFCKVYKNGEELENDAIVGTGAIVSIVVGDITVASYKISVAGDVDGDGKVSTVDSNILKRIIAGTYIPENKETVVKAADVDKNGSVNSVDSNILKRAIAGIYQITE